MITPKLLDKFKNNLDKFLMEFKDYTLTDVDNDLVQKALVTHHLTVDYIKSEYVEKIVKERV